MSPRRTTKYSKNDTKCAINICFCTIYLKNHKSVYYNIPSPLPAVLISKFKLQCGPSKSKYYALVKRFQPTVSSSCNFCVTSPKKNQQKREIDEIYGIGGRLDVRLSFQEEVVVLFKAINSCVYQLVSNHVSINFKQSFHRRQE